MLTLVEQKKPGDRALVSVIREGRQVDVEVVLGASERIATDPADECGRCRTPNAGNPAHTETCSLSRGLICVNAQGLRGAWIRGR